MSKTSTTPDADPKADPKPEQKTGAPDGFKLYRSTAFSVLFDVQVKGEVIYGQWANGLKAVEFQVPEHLVEGFEKHYHFASGNIVAV